MRTPSPLFAAILLASSPSLFSQDGKTEATTANDTPESALKKLSVAPGLQVDLWAAEPHLVNPVAFSFDEKGRAFVIETNRRRSGALDIRRYMDWLTADLAFRSVDDRVAFLKQAMEKSDGKRIKDLNGDGKSDWHDLEVEGEQIRMVVDSDGDGNADHDTLFAKGFAGVGTAVAAGVLAHEGNIFLACIPDLWRLHDGKGNGVADEKEKLLSGFGVHIAYGGHDMHGVKSGPDGRIYWSIADTGARVTTREGKLIDQPDCGAIFRCNPDATGMELVMSGLRNPQSLAFNDFGDLFTGDNNADGGDKARWVHVVEGGDAGWRIGWQFLPKLGAWNSEKLWELDTDTTALSQLPPVGHIGHGPAGIAFYPGTGLPESYNGHFFFADFPGGVRSFSIKQKGASYTVDNPDSVLLDNSAKVTTGKVLWNLYPSDVQFGVDGGVYVLDWVYGWEKTGKGRIFRVHAPAVDQSALVLETKTLLGEGMAKRETNALSALLAHADQRVRLAAQFELVRRGDPIPLARATLNTQPRLARLHGIWGVTQIARLKPDAARALMPLFADADAEVRGQWAKFIGEARVADERESVIRLLNDPEPRVRFFAAMALAKVGGNTAVAPLLEMLRENADKDAYLRHAGVMALAANAEPALLAAAAHDDSESIRLAALLALRRLGRVETADFLNDKSPRIALEAARAIHDTPISAALPKLAEMVPQASPPFSRRAINAAYHLGTVRKLVELALQPKAAEASRLDAIEALAQWNQILGRDRVTGLFHPLPGNRGEASLEAGGALPELLKDSSQSIRLASLEMATALKLAQCEEPLASAAVDKRFSGPLRAAALKALAAIQSPKLAEAVSAALLEKDKTLLAEARRLEGIASPEKAIEQSIAALKQGTVAEKQGALQTLGNSKLAAADQVLANWLDLLSAGEVLPGIQLDLLEAVAKRTEPLVVQKLAAFEGARPAADPLARWRECFEGGDAKAGREVFYEKAEAACMRCHKIKGEGGDVGPDLAGIITRHDRLYILASIVDPNAVVAPGYDNVLITLKDGNLVAGVVSGETGEELTLTQLADGSKLKVKKVEIKSRDAVPSAMPPGLGEVLGKRDLRNVVEFLATLK
ncbi:MAG: Heme-binding protein [Chthoniobacteraceae bacterium]|nr:Heme-binding protein [Chthoniobacteraceae bacterium]